MIFGLNGSGKSTIAEALRNVEPRRDIKSDKPVTEIAVFNQRWVDENVGDLISGKSAKSISTLVIGKENKRLNKKRKKAKIEEKEAQTKVEEAVQKQASIQTEISNIKSKISNIRKEYGDKLPKELGSRVFTAPKIEECLSNLADSPKTVETKSITELLNLTNMPEPDIPSMPEDLLDVSTLELDWADLLKPLEKVGKIKVNQWIREGMELNEPGSECQFCGGRFTQQRAKDIVRAIAEADKVADNKQEVAKARIESQRQNVLLMLKHYERNRIALEEFQEPWAAALQEFQDALIEYENQLEMAATALEKRIANPFDSDKTFQPDANSMSEIVRANKHIRKVFGEYIARLRNFKSVRAEAIEEAKQAFCQPHLEEYKNTYKRLKKAERTAQEAKDALAAAEKSIKDISGQMSTSAQMAKIISEQMNLILGDETIKVLDDPKAKEYRVLRGTEPATYMSEGEKKILALLYFCTTLRDTESEHMNHKIVVLDDLGAELDDARLLFLDRFITSFLKGSPTGAPAAIIYTTHSTGFLRILVDRLLNDSENNNKFYEVYKGIASDNTIRPIGIREIPADNLKLKREYYLALHLLLSEVKRLMDGHARGADVDISYGIANWCRKALEGFTDFRWPGTIRFGTKVDNACKQFSPSSFAAITKLANHGSHSDFERQNEAWSYSLLVRLLAQTLYFVYFFDPKHFEAVAQYLVDQDFKKNPSFRSQLIRFIVNYAGMPVKLEVLEAEEEGNNK